MAQPNRSRKGGREEIADTVNTEAGAGEQTSKTGFQAGTTTAYQAGSASQSQSGSAESHSGGNGMAQKIREQVNARLSSQKDRALDGVGGLTEAIRQTSRSLRDNQHDTIAQYLEQAVGQVDQFAQTLRNKDIRELMLGAQQLARRRPAMFVGSAFAIGLLSARFFKSSPPDRAEDMHYGAGYGTGEYRTRGMASSSTPESFVPPRQDTDLRGFEQK